MPPHRRDASLYLAALALFAAALRSLALAAEMTNGRGTTQAAPSAAASAAAGSGGGGGASGDALGGRLLSSSSFAPPWASAFASVSSVTASAACSLFGREASAAARDSRLGLATAAACEVATNLELWLEPLLSGREKGAPFLPAGAARLSPLPSSSSPSSDALAADRAAVASTAAAAASTSSGGASSAASASATANARPVCSAALLFPGAGVLVGGGVAPAGKGPSGSPPALVPVCSAPSFELVADGGRCAVESRPPHVVVCVGPSVVLEVMPARCSLGADGNGGSLLSSSSSSSRSLVVDGHCGPPASVATGGQRVFLGGKRLPAFVLNGSSSSSDDGSGDGGGAPSAAFDRAAAALSSWPAGWGGAPLADAEGLAELLAVSLLPGKVTATASVVEE